MSDPKLYIDVDNLIEEVVRHDETLNCVFPQKPVTLRYILKCAARFNALIPIDHLDFVRLLDYVNIQKAESTILPGEERIMIQRSDLESLLKGVRRE